MKKNFLITLNQHDNSKDYDGLQDGNVILIKHIMTVWAVTWSCKSGNKCGQSWSNYGKKNLRNVLLFKIEWPEYF